MKAKAAFYFLILCRQLLSLERYRRKKGVKVKVHTELRAFDDKYFYISQIGIYILKIHMSTWNLDYMIPKGISHISVQNPTYEFQKRNIGSIQENISSIQNYQGLSLLPIIFTSLADLFPQLNIDSFVRI